MKSRITALFVSAGMVACCAGCGSSNPDTSGQPANGRSMFTASVLSSALAQAQSKLGGQAVSSIKIEPRAIIVSSANGQDVIVDVNGNARTFGTGFAHTTGSFPLSSVSPSAVQKVVQGVEAKGHLIELNVEYVLASAILGQPEFGVYPRSHTGYWRADLSGSNIQGVGTANSGGTTGTGGGGTTVTGGRGTTTRSAAPSGGSSQSLGRAQAIAQCVRNANGDVTKMKACVGQ